MKKKIGIIIGVLVVIVGITAYMNMRNSKSLIALQENAQFSIKEDGNEKMTFTLDQIRQFGETDFKGNYKTKGKDAVEYTYTGVPFKNVLKEAGIPLADKTSVVVSSVDGYAVPYDIEKIKEDDNIYLAYMKEKEALKEKDDGGCGPFLIVVSKDQFSQNWAKFAVEADVK